MAAALPERNKNMDHREESRIREQLHSLAAAGNYREADRVLEEYKARGGRYDDVIAIYDGSTGQSLGDSRRVWAAIRQGLCCNPDNYELYVMLGNYYLDENQEQSWLCFEHALACCKDPEDQAQIREMLGQLSEGLGVRAGRVAVVIQCHGGGSVEQCVEQVRKDLAGCQGQVVAVTAGERLHGRELEWLRQQADVVVVEPDGQREDGTVAASGQGQQSLVWEKGVAAAWTDADCLFLDSGTLLPDHALFWLRMALYGSREAGTAGSMSSRIVNSRVRWLAEDGTGSAVPEPGGEGLSGFQDKVSRINVPMRYPFQVIPWTKGAAVLVRRQVLDQAGVPGEVFRDGVLLDRDYGRKVEAAGYRNLLCENSFLVYQQEAAGDPGRAGAGQSRDSGKDGKPAVDGAGAQGARVRQTAGKAGTGRTQESPGRFLLFYAGNEKGYYQDTRYFTTEIAGELERLGHSTFICDLARGTHDGAAMEAFLTEGVDAVLTFNGEAIQKEELWQLWNQLGALVVNILMDPPFHMDLRPYLESPCLERYLLLCPDELHVDYVKQYFPQVKHVEFMPHGGTPVKGRPVPWREKKLDLLFSGTYTRPEGFLDVMRQTMKPEDFKLYRAMGERLLEDTGLSVDQVVSETLFPEGWPVTPDRIDGAVSGMSLLDGWVRMVTRERVVTALAEGGVDIHVLGDGWQNCPCAGNPHLHSLTRERIPLADTLAWMENARICLNVMPWFKAGSHDRVFNAMLRESVALTDASRFFRKHFRDQESVVYYSLKEPERLPRLVTGLLENPDQGEAIARKGYQEAQVFTWEHYVEDLLGKIRECSE
jgi:hypothetical protein